MTTTKPTPKEKIAHLEAELRKCQLALFDIYNQRFSKPVVLKLEQYLGKEWASERLEMSASWRVMPLFLVVWKSTAKPGVAARKTNAPYYMTETEMEDLARLGVLTDSQRAMRDAYQELKRLHTITGQ